MAADNIVGNMFGVDPNDLARQRMEANNAAALQYAQLDPFQRAAMGMYQAGGMLAGAGARAMGLQTPEEQKATVRQQALSGLDTSNPDHVAIAIKRLSDAGDTQGATVLAQEYRKMKIEQSKQAQEAAQTAYANAKAADLENEKRKAGVRPVHIGGDMMQDYAVDAAGNVTQEKVGVPYKDPTLVKVEASASMKPGDELRWMNQHTKDRDSAVSVIDESNDATKKVNSIVSDPKFGYMFGGYTEKALSKLAPGEIAGISAQIESLKSNLKQAGLNTMRQKGSIGAMTEKEWPIVESTIASLDPKMDEKSARKAFGLINSFFERAKSRASDSYTRKWKSKSEFYDSGVTEMGSAPATPAPVKPSASQSGWSAKIKG